MNVKSPTTTWTGVSAAIAATLTILAALPYQLGDVATLIPVEWKPRIVLIGMIATLALKIWNAVAQAGTKEVSKLSEKVDHIDPGADI